MNTSDGRVVAWNAGRVPDIAWHPSATLEERVDYARVLLSARYGYPVCGRVVAEMDGYVYICWLGCPHVGACTGPPDLN